MISISKQNIEDLRVGDEVSFKEVISEDMVDQFVSLTGDRSTLHINNNFALQRGFKGRVVHGVLLLGFLSRAVGMYLPGENALLQNLNSHFLAPAYIGEAVLIKINVEQISKATRTILLKASIEKHNSGIVVLRSKIQVGFTSEK